jgi:putative transposase
VAKGRVSRPNEKENARLKRLVADLSIEKQVLKDIAEGNL